MGMEDMSSVVESEGDKSVRDESAGDSGMVLGRCRCSAGKGLAGTVTTAGKGCRELMVRNN